MNHELRYCASRSPNKIDIEFLYQGLHEFPEKLNKTVEDALKRVNKDDCDYILLNYGLCGNGTLNITHPEVPIVIHNVQDCIPVLIGDKLKYSRYIKKNPATFFFSCGWIEGFPLPGSPDYAERYSEFYNMKITEKQRNIIEKMLFENYRKLAFIRCDELGEGINRYGSCYTKKCVSSINKRLSLNMSYDEVKGGIDILERFVNGKWDNNEFLILEPDQRLNFNITKSKLYVE